MSLSSLSRLSSWKRCPSTSYGLCNLPERIQWSVSKSSLKAKMCKGRLDPIGSSSAMSPTSCKPAVNDIANSWCPPLTPKTLLEKAETTTCLIPNVRIRIRLSYLSIWDSWWGAASAPMSICPLTCHKWSGNKFKNSQWGSKIINKLINCFANKSNLFLIATKM